VSAAELLGPESLHLRVVAHKAMRLGKVSGEGADFLGSAPPHWEVHERTNSLPNKGTGRPWALFASLFGDIWPAREEGLDVGGGARRGLDGFLGLDILLIQGLEGRVGDLIARGPSPSQTARS